ncbi:sporulation protein YunB [Bacillus sp. AFS040349]|uniref:sporulation protein YunB n=1 Tax=Bacillus sp. AFS040349 TaxID=2033502 RepID=UPI000BFD3925|nr:sporulation protein YunB [Bacillus sp. AFS040349]PGT85376.1 sporulation protein YunB [Bacillus sp. AFS040349]
MAKFRGRRPRKGPLPFRYVLLLTLVIFTILTASSFWYVDSKVEPAIMDIAKLEASSVATTIIHEAVKEETEKDQENLVIIDKDNNGNTNTIRFNSAVVRAELDRITDNITRKLTEIEKGNFHTTDNQEMELDDGIVYSIPLGQITDNAILSTIGPDIPVRFYLIGDVHTDIKRTLKEYGINSAVHEISVIVEVTVQVVIPFSTKPVTITNTIPIVDIAAHGDVPQYYNNGSGENAPAIELPAVP